MDFNQKKIMEGVASTLKSTPFEIGDLAKYLRTRRLITVNAFQNLVNLDKSQAIDAIFECLIRKGERAVVALRDWLARNVPVDVYKQMTGEEIPECKRKLLPSFNSCMPPIGEEVNQMKEEEGVIMIGKEVKQMKEGEGVIMTEETSEVPGEKSFNTEELCPSHPIREGRTESSPTNIQENPTNQMAALELEDSMNEPSDTELLNMVFLQNVEEAIGMEEVNPDNVVSEELWYEIMRDTCSMGDVSNDTLRCKLSLGKNVFVTAGVWKGSLSIHIRRYDASNTFPTPKGIVFSLPLWKQLANLSEDIDANVEKMQKMPSSDCILEVGNRTYVEVEDSRYPKIDIRLWWYPPCSRSLKRTTKGVKLNFWQWEKLKAVFKHIHVFVPELN